MLTERYEGTRTGRQELYAELLDDYDGALWTRDQIDRDRLTSNQVPELARIAIGIDPSGYSPELGAEPTGPGRETGIIVVGIDRQQPPHIYVLDDASGRSTGAQWARRVVDLYHHYSEIAPTVLVPELNLAGPLVLGTIRLVDDRVRFYPNNERPGVRAAKGKRARAEEPATLYEQQRAHHAGHFAELEDQLCTWDPEQSWSPDRLDALVWAIHALQPWRPRRRVRGISPVDIERRDARAPKAAVEIPRYEYRPDAERIIRSWAKKQSSAGGNSH
jgi:phage terminase large subunit-like protein